MKSSAADRFPSLVSPLLHLIVRIQKKCIWAVTVCKVAGQVDCAMGGIPRLPMKARWMASKVLSPCLRAEPR